jgi:membrane-anchored glycerophosphoryl diester phosphodiesterase (GDPDase)
MNDLSVSVAISQGWELAKKHGLLLACFFLVFNIITNVISTFELPAGYWSDYVYAIQHQNVQTIQNVVANGEVYSGKSTLLSLLIAVLGIIFSVGITNTILQLTKGTMTSVSFNGYNVPIMTYVKYFVVILITGLIILVGLVLCIIPGIYFAVRLNYATCYIIDNPDAGIGESINASWNMTKNNFWSVLGLNISCIGIAILGLLCCCIGYFFSAAFIGLIQASAYYTLLKNINTDTLDAEAY